MSWLYFYIMIIDVLAVLKVLIAQFFSILRNFETGRDSFEKHRTKSLDLQEIYEFDPRVFVVSPTVLKLQSFFKKWSDQYFWDC